MKRFMAAALAVGCLVSPATVFAADDAGAFDKGLSRMRRSACPSVRSSQTALSTRLSAARELPHI
jgi:hypothetical protein